MGWGALIAGLIQAGGDFASAHTQARAMEKAAKRNNLAQAILFQQQGTFVKNAVVAAIVAAGVFVVVVGFKKAIG